MDRTKESGGEGKEFIPKLPGAAEKEEEDVSHFTVKHPLQSVWTLWYDAPQKRGTSAASWSNNLKTIMNFDTVEDFWSLYNNIAPASTLSNGANYHLFKKGIEPTWEDPANENGGKWVIGFPSKGRDGLDKYWLFTILAMIGESIEAEGDNICGAVVSLRKGGDRIALWTKISDDKDRCLAIGRGLRAQLEVPPETQLTFHTHSVWARGSKMPLYTL